MLSPGKCPASAPLLSLPCFCVLPRRIRLRNYFSILPHSFFTFNLPFVRQVQYLFFLLFSFPLIFFSLFFLTHANASANAINLVRLCVGEPGSSYRLYRNLFAPRCVRPSAHSDQCRRSRLSPRPVHFAFNIHRAFSIACIAKREKRDARA